MRREAIELFNFPEEKIFVSGVPRFDNYFRRKNMRSRSEFLKSYNLDPDKKLVTYTTSHDRLFWPHEVTSPEPEIVRFLARAIQNDELGAPSQLLVRLHPQASPKLYEQLAKEEGITLQIPGRSSRFQDRDLSIAEGVLLGETMMHSDVVVNVASTITIDASIFGTPVVCIGFDMRGERTYLTSARRFYDFDHYKKLAKTSGFRIASHKEDLVKEMRHYLADPARDREGRQKIVAEQCYYVDGRSAERVAHHIQNLLGIRSHSVASTKPLSVNSILEPTSADAVRG
jgi:CDP-glycerol glycerophosphotransferase (TagB/SpsB family)